MSFTDVVSREVDAVITRDYQNGRIFINVRRVRRVQAIPASDKSRVVYIAACLDQRAAEGVLQCINEGRSPREYRILKAPQVPEKREGEN